MPNAAKKETIEERWTKYAEDRLVGRKIIEVRYLTKDEVEGMGWYRSCLVIVLDDGTFMFPSRDDEGNGAGALFGQGAKGEEMTFPVI